MKISQIFKARGHKNITLKHKTTIMITTDSKLSLNGDCIAAINSDIGLIKLKPELKKAIQNPKAKVCISLKVDNNLFEICGKGHSKLTLESPTDIVARKSNYICPRTILIHADKSSIDVPRSFVKALQDSPHINVTITAYL